MLVQIHVGEDVDIRVEIIRKPSASKLSVAVHPSLEQEPFQDHPAPQSNQHLSEPSARFVGSAGACGNRTVQHSKPLLLFVSGHEQPAGPRCTGDTPVRLTAGAWLEDGSQSLNLLTNISSITLAHSKEVAELGAVYTALISPKLQQLMLNSTLLRVISGVQRNITLLNSAEVGSKKFDTAVAAHIRRLAAVAPYTIQFIHASEISKAASAAGIRKARILAEQCERHEQVCNLRQVALLGMGR